MRNISIFKRRVMSGAIRGNQIAPFINAKLNPLEGYENDLCIFIKWTPAITKWGTRYLDVIDRHQCIDWLKVNNDCGAIAISLLAFDYLKSVLPDNEVVFIPQHHCNFGNEKRPDRAIKTVGYCGEHHTFARFENEFRSKLAANNLELLFYPSYRTRQDVVEFYKKIDIQLVYREEPGYIQELKNPLKLSNAGSFRIPTVAVPERNFLREYDCAFVLATSIDNAIDSIVELSKDNVYYNLMAKKAEAIAKKYHVLEIAKYYTQLAEK